ncbi:tetratricopeptide repeat protein [Nocardia sp. NBC_01329]|uniref:tetratricopeptide repeat protein n=1 Tax=Nocardia sp. NBC_01329 TaxID=2903594 RepID=UPI002E0D517F|nr:tetratricopeptide repeat protein [Nocardia sp. NBC_01329]
MDIESAGSSILRKDVHYPKGASVFGPDHPDILLSCNNLATAYHDADRGAEAILLLDETLTAYERFSVLTTRIRKGSGQSRSRASDAAVVLSI